MRLTRTMVFGTAALAAGTLAAAFDDVTCERFPDADVVQVDEIERVKYGPDGTSETFAESWTKLMTEKGRRDESTQTLGYSKRYGEAEIVFVKAIAADGTERTIDVSGTMKESTDNADMSANIYDPLDRKIVCTIPGLKVGEVLHVKMRRKVLKPRTEGKWSGIAILEWTHPILRSTYEITAPAALPLRKIAVRHPLGNVARSERKLADGSTVHTFVATNSAQVFPEPDMPALYTQVQNVRVSTAGDWPEISRWYWELCRPHLERTNAAISNKVEELCRPAGVDRLRAIFKFVSQEIRYMGLTMEDKSPGYAPHDVNITFDNRYGVCRDKAGLLVAMLRIAGFEAYPVLIHVGAKLDPEVPQPFFNHAIVAVTDGKGYVLMDPTNESTKDIFPAYLCNRSYLVARPEGETLRTSAVPSPADNALEIRSDGALGKDGSLFLENEILFGGINDTAYRHALVKRTPEDRVKFFERIVKSAAPGAELVRCEIEPKDMRDTDAPLKVRLASRLPETVLRGETLDELNVPFISRAFGMVNFLLEGSTSLEKRRFPLVLDTTAQVTERLELDLAGALGKVAVLPHPMKVEGGYDYRRRFAVSDAKLAGERRLAIAAVEFSPEDYLKLREDIKRVEAAERKRPLFEVDGSRDADVRCILDSSETTVFSDREWVTTNTVVKEVLTYDGKKRSAEVKLDFHPDWKNVEVVTAVVSNRDGTVKSATAREMNVMDCGWASAAPRYPAAKTLVVNLPSVEIGSVIALTTVTTVTNAPVPFYAEYAFDSTEPLERRVVRVNGWRREAVRPRRIPDEPGQPSAFVWRDREIVSSNRFAKIDFAVGEADPAALTPALDETSVVSIRNWMARYVRVTGPGLFDLPLDRQLTPPERVLKERYATRLDYVRTLCALLRGAGYEADVLLSSADADALPETKERIMRLKPRQRSFASALCRVRIREGGFLGFGGTTTTYFIGTENEYAPLGASAYAGSDYFDPETAEFGVVTVPEADLEPFGGEENAIFVRENGAVDMEISTVKKGPGVGAYRKRFVEMLPEDRSRYYQGLLGGIAQAATATADLVTDTEGYPAKTTFACHVPDYAVVSGDTISLTLPAFECELPTWTGTSRRTPISIDATERSSDGVTVTFPEGYTEIEHMPEAFAFADPADASRPWIVNRVSSEMKDGRLVVRIVRETMKRPDSWYGADRFELIRDWRRIATSRANRTIIVRRKTK